MSPEQVLSLVRTILKFFGGFLVSYGFLDASGVAQVVGAAMTLIAAIWSWYTHTPIKVPADTSGS